MKLRLKKADKQKDEKPKGPCIYRRDPTTNLWKGEDGCMYRLDTHGTNPPHLDLQKKGRHHDGRHTNSGEAQSSGAHAHADA